MTVQDAVQQLEYASVTERIQAIELLLQSLKDEFARNESNQAMRQPFRIR